ncbi:MAG: DNA polymerase I [Clostridiales bacterium]|nr:DNA polymerase I [Clostridiales bacterium]
MEKDSLIVIDGNSLINRAFFALPAMTTSRAEPVGAVYGFTNMLIKLIEEYSPKYIAAAFDVHAPTFRHKMSPLYKATRKPMPQELAVQMDTLKSMLSAMNIKMFELPGYEADDLIGTIAKTDVFTYILTGDRDSLQLVGENTHALLTKKGISELVDVSPDNVSEVFGVNAQQVVDFKALAGDSSDNIPGVPGIGDKTAASLLAEFGSLDGIYASIDKITGSKHDKLAAGKDSAYLSQKLATIDCNAPIDFDIEECKLVYPFPAEVRDFFANLEFKTLSKRAELFQTDGGAVPETAQSACTRELDKAELIPTIENLSGGKVAVLLDKSGLHFASSSDVDYFAPVTDDLFSKFTYADVQKAVKTLAEKFEHIITFDVKSLMHAVRAEINADDVALMAYLLEYRLSPMTAAELFELYHTCDEQLVKREMVQLYKSIELPLSHVLYNMEVDGFTIDRKRLDEADAQFGELEKKSADRIIELYGKDLNLNSPKQLAQALFVDLGIPYPGGKPPYSTKAEILQQLSGEYEIVDEILKYRFNSKLKSTFIDGLRKAMRSDGTVHTSFNQMTTSTGRLSSTDPNLQNIPTRADEGRIVRSIFVPRDGHVLVDADYSQIELKLLAHFSADQKMVAAFRSGADIHASTASEVFDVPQDKVTSEMRRDAKAVNFGIVYGISNYGLSRNIHISAKRADQYIKRYFERFPAVKAYLDDLVDSAKKNGYAVTMFNRRRAIPELNSGKFNERKFGERVAMNMPLQGTAADIIKIAMINVARKLENTKSKLILQVHDELIVDAAEDEVDKVKDILKTEMENAVKLSVPLDVSVSVGKNWMECK